LIASTGTCTPPLRFGQELSASNDRSLQSRPSGRDTCTRASSKAGFSEGQGKQSAHAAGNMKMGKAVASSFVFAVVAILAASFFAPRSNAGVEASCSTAYGVNPCDVVAFGRPVHGS